MYPEPPYKRVGIKFPPALLRRLDKLVKATNSNRSEVIRVAVTDMLDSMTILEQKLRQENERGS